MNNWIEVSQENLGWNFRAVAAAAGAETEILPVVKANGYGHGAEACSVGLVAAGARWLGVTCAAEGVRVRNVVNRGGAGPQVLVMCGFLAGDVSTMCTYGLTPVVWTEEQVGWLEGERGMKVHVEVDTGMGRQGVRPGAELAELLRRISDIGLELDGVFTHFCSSEVAGSELTQRQERLFEGAVAQVKEAGFRPSWVHAGNTSTVDNPAQDWPWLVELAKTVGARAMVRTGLAVYGYCLPVEGCGTARVQPELRPVMTWKAHVLAVRDLAAGDTVGYNATFTAERAMRVAVVGVGYADGLRRELSGCGWMMWKGERVGILGRISMNLTVVDVSGLDRVRAGDEVVVLGQGITAEDHARLAGTIAYEILCGVKPCG